MKPSRCLAIRRTLLSILALALASPPAGAITDEEIFRDFRFNFANPGARALAMGGAFIAIANDATAAQANPSRLAFLDFPEFFIEARRRDTEATARETPTISLDPSHPSASLTLGAGNEPETQTIPSVVSFVYPFKFARKLGLGVSRQEVLSVESESANISVLIPTNSGLFQDPPGSEIVTTTGNGSIDASLILWNLSGGYQITENLFVGGSVVFGELDLRSEQVGTLSDPFQLTTLGQSDPRYQVPPSQAAELIRSEIDDSDTDVRWSFGLYLKLNDYLSLGTVYRKGVKMQVEERVVETGVERVETVTFNVPDVAGFGVSYKPFAGSASAAAQRLLFALDVVRVENEDIVDGFTSQLNVLTSQTFLESAEFTADNQTQVHLGAEYYFLFGRKALLFVRGGFFTDPDSSVHLDRAGSDTGRGVRVGIVEGDAFPGRDDETHVTGGIGFTYGNFELAAAVDSSDIENQSLFSAIYRIRR